MSFKDWIKRFTRDRPWLQSKRKPFPATHRIGLPIADGSAVTIDMLDDCYIFATGSGDSWYLPKERVTNIECLYETQIQTHIKNRPGMALLGGLTLGYIGAIAGAVMTKETRSEVVTQFIVFDYINQNGELAALLFQFFDDKDMYSKWQKPRLFLKDFKKNRDKYAQAGFYTL